MSHPRDINDGLRRLCTSGFASLRHGVAAGSVAGPVVDLSAAKNNRGFRSLKIARRFSRLVPVLRPWACSRCGTKDPLSPDSGARGLAFLLMSVFADPCGSLSGHQDSHSVERSNPTITAAPHSKVGNSGCAGKPAPIRFPLEVAERNRDGDVFSQ
jgi:hypothetical protein